MRRFLVTNSMKRFVVTNFFLICGLLIVVPLIMTGNIAFITNVWDISLCPVGLLNGKNVVAIKSGYAQLGAALSQKNVLYIPQLKCYLLPVSKLLKQLNVWVVFTSDYCVRGPYIEDPDWSR